MGPLKLFLSIWILSVSIFVVFGDTEFPCTWSYKNANFSLCRWQQTSNSQGMGYWEVYDESDYSSNNYTYQFNICGDVINTNNLNEMCINNTLRKEVNYPVGYCNNIINGTYDDIKKCKCIKINTNGTCIEEDISPITVQSAGYQMPREKSNEDCYRLHDGITPPTFSLIDDKDPSIGVSIKYIGGDWCPAFGVKWYIIFNLLFCDISEKCELIDRKIENLRLGFIVLIIMKMYLIERKE